MIKKLLDLTEEERKGLMQVPCLLKMKTSSKDKSVKFFTLNVEVLPTLSLSFSTTQSGFEMIKKARQLKEGYSEYRFTGYCRVLAGKKKLTGEDFYIADVMVAPIPFGCFKAFFRNDQVAQINYCGLVKDLNVIEIGSDEDQEKDMTDLFDYKSIN